MEQLFKPKMRLFLSVDLIGSTKIKFSNSNLPLSKFVKDNDSVSRGNKTIFPYWHCYIFSFFQQFDSIMRSSEAKFLSLQKLHGNKSEIGELHCWKKIGDQIVYLVEIRNAWQVYFWTIIFLHAIDSYREEVRKQETNKDDPFHKLRERKVTAGIWLAGFPMINAEIPIAKPISDQKAENFNGYDTIDNLLDLELLLAEEPVDESIEPKLSYRKKIDFVGPSMDTGFRLCSDANEKQIPISIELAYVLAVVADQIENKQHYSDWEPIITAIREKYKFTPNIFFGGYKSFKGVFEGDAYPEFWLSSPGLDTKSKNLPILDSMICKPEIVINFCNEIFSSHTKYLFKPFIDGCQLLGEKPENYVQYIGHWEKIFQVEKGRGSGLEKT